MTRFLFHLCPPDLRDETIYPLNELRTRHPDLHRRECGKWSGRESVCDLRIPHLGCSWADTVNLSAIDPRRLVTARVEMGLPPSRLLGRRLMRIPLERIGGLDAVWFASTGHWLNSRPGDPEADSTPPEADFAPFDRDRYRELGDVPPAHRRYLRQQADVGQEALGFVFIPHVLVQGAIPLSGLAPEPL